MRLIVTGLVCLLGIGALAACSREHKYSEAKIIGPEEEIAALQKSLQHPSFMVHGSAAKRLGDFGPAAKSALPALKEFAKKHPKLKKETDEAIAKIEGRAPTT